ncbi:MAG: DMT family protein [Verrucomicrobia bacterium]|nr:DMT family protein [Verrucomicrobiota bacterium]
MKTILLLVGSNIFMTFAWYGQLKLKIFEGKAVWTVILMSWTIAFFEYCLMVPANRSGYAQGMSGYQLKILQEVITLGVFVCFAWLVLGEKLKWNYAVSFGLILLAVYFATAFNKTGGASGH